MFYKTPLLLCILLAGCGTPTYTYREIEVPDRTYEDIWRTLATTTRQMGWAADRNSLDRGKGVFQSGWNVHLSDQTRRCKRQRLRVEVERQGAGQPGWRVRCYVEEQHIATFGAGLDPKEEDWEPAGQNKTAEDMFVGVLRGKLGLGVIEPRSPRESKTPDTR